jgi:hypothetical protein
MTIIFWLILGGLGLAYLIASVAGFEASKRQGGAGVEKLGALLGVAAFLAVLVLYAPH